MRGFLINYNASIEYINRHPDPCFSEFTYGNINKNASFIRNRMSKGDRVFFHATMQNPIYGRYITGCFIIEKIIEGNVARRDEYIRENYKNHHFHELDRKPIDVIIFGNEESIDIQDNPICLDRHLAEKLSFHSKNDKIQFKNGFTDLACIGSSTRAFRELTDISTEFLWNSCKNKSEELNMA